MSLAPCSNREPVWHKSAETRYRRRSFCVALAFFVMAQKRGAGTKSVQHPYGHFWLLVPAPLF